MAARRAEPVVPLEHLVQQEAVDEAAEADPERRPGARGAAPG
jgi:hypothetical protein